VPKDLYNGVIVKRQYAYIADFVLWHATGITLFVWSGFREFLVDSIAPSYFAFAGIMLAFAYRSLFILKDGFGGCSPGKLLFGLRVVDQTTGVPIGPGRSAQRNLLLLLPGIGELVLLAQMSFGPRSFDRWANCVVVDVGGDEGHSE
jgi:uncharacterized RDD family membrane protein YckC